MSELHLLSPKGFRAGGAYAGIKTRKVNDVGVLACDTLATAAAAFTTNKVFAAPIAVGRQHAADGKLRGLVINSGNANACTGKRGLQDANEMCALAAAQLKCKPADILPGSTGIIGHHLPMAKVRRGIVEASQNLGNSSEHSIAFNDAILTTDTRRKFAAARLKLGKQTITLTGICKGAGMIGPHMVVPKQATMLAYLLTDADIAPNVLRKLLATSVDKSFNCVTIDNHMSTNDTAVLLASGVSGGRADSPASIKKFANALNEVTSSLAQQIAADGEGATKTVTVRVRAAASDADARRIARAIADSPLVKCAMHGNDPNWGRIVSAAGMCGARFNPDRAKLTLQGHIVFRNGKPVVFDAQAVSASLKSKQVLADLHCGARAGGEATVWTCDFSKEYVTINADYHT